MALTVGIATTGDDPRTLRETVEGVIRSASIVDADAEVLVVVNGRDRVPELHDIGSPTLRVVYLERRNVAVARNTVLAEARYDTILFTDDDCAVPPEWCSQLAAGLHAPGCVAVGAPVRVEVTGPVSAYFDYQRQYNATPAGPGGPLLLVTTNSGLRRDRIPASIRFDPTLHSAGEDSGFSLALAKAGLPARWLFDATPIRHGLSERIEEITERFRRNAYHGVQLYLGLGHQEASIPGVLRLYRQRIQDDFHFDRRFSELPAIEARIAFSVYDSLATAAMMVGYLDRLGKELAHPLLELDLPGLARFVNQIADQVREQTTALSTSDWAALEVDYRGMRQRLRESQPLLAKVRRGLRRYAAPIPTDPGGPVGDVLDLGAGTQTDNYVDSLAGFRQAYADVCAGAGTPDELDRAAFALGVPFKVATNAIEFTLLLDSLYPAALS